MSETPYTSRQNCTVSNCGVWLASRTAIENSCSQEYRIVNSYWVALVLAIIDYNIWSEFIVVFIAYRRCMEYVKSYWVPLVLSIIDRAVAVPALQRKASCCRRAIRMYIPCSICIYAILVYIPNEIGPFSSYILSYLWLHSIWLF